MESFIDKYYNEMSTRQKESDNKRARAEFSSASEPEMAEISSADRHLLNTIHEQLEQLKKLDLLQDMSRDINELKTSVEFTNKLIEELRAENANLKSNVEELQVEVGRLSKENRALKEDILDMQCRSMKNNVIIMGLEEEKGETYVVTRNIVKDFMNKDLKMAEDELAKVAIEITHRIGQIKADGTPRPVVVKFATFEHKLEVLAQGHKLKGSHYSMFEQFPREIVDRRRVLVPIMKTHKARKAKTRLVVDKLYIDNQLFRDSKITPWLL